MVSGDIVLIGSVKNNDESSERNEIVQEEAVGGGEGRGGEGRIVRVEEEDERGGTWE